MKSSSTIIATIAALTFRTGEASSIPNSDSASHVLRRADEGTCFAFYSGNCQDSDVTVLIGALDQYPDQFNTQGNSWGYMAADDNCSILGRAVGVTQTSSLYRDIVDALNRLEYACGSTGEFTGTTYASGNGAFQLLVTGNPNGYQGTNINPN